MLDDNRTTATTMERAMGGAANDSSTQHDGTRPRSGGDDTTTAINKSSSAASLTASSAASSATSVTTARAGNNSREASPVPNASTVQQQSPHLDTISAPSIRVGVASNNPSEGLLTEANSSPASGSPVIQANNKFEAFPSSSPRSSIPNADLFSSSEPAAAAAAPAAPASYHGGSGGGSGAARRGHRHHHRHQRTHSDNDIPRTIQASASFSAQQQHPQLGQYASYSFGGYPPPPPPPPPMLMMGSSLPTSYAAGPSPYGPHTAPQLVAGPHPHAHGYHSFGPSNAAPNYYPQQQQQQQLYGAPFRPSPAAGGAGGQQQQGGAFPPPQSRPRTYSDGGGGGNDGPAHVSATSSSSFGGGNHFSQESAMMSGSGAPPPRPGMAMMSAQQQQQLQLLQSPSSFGGEGRPLLSKQQKCLSERGIDSTGGGGMAGAMYGSGAAIHRMPHGGNGQQIWSSGQPPTPQQQHPRRPRGGGGPRGRHRKSHSSSEVFGNSTMRGGYGSIWSHNERDGGGEDDDDDENAGNRAPPAVQQTRSFDPRGEFMSLTGLGGRSPRSGGGGAGPPTSPMAGGSIGRKVYGGRPGPLGGPYAAGNNSMGSAPYMVQNSIGSQASVGSQRGGGNRIVWSPAINMSVRGDLNAIPSLGGSLGSGGTEALLSAQSSKRVKNESVRRKHMRQHSAQLYMENFKGVEQPRRCRDVVFLLLFAFHLFGIVYLGNLYAKEAFAARSVDEQKKHSTVTVYYRPLLYLSCVSGAFSVVLSSILLAMMSIFPKNFVQVALVVVITLSFVWGTIGIGLSPNNFVPITGIIALAFSVMYAFIVWDRIPFAAANLAAALSAIRSHPRTVLVAVILQFLTLLWCIYYCIVVIGVYDSIRVGKLQVSHNAAVALYVLLGTSFYWTYQVLSNTLQTITASVIGKWWYKQDSGHAVRESAFRTIFYSMGSICYGSLFLGPVSFIRQVAVLFRPAVQDEASLICLHECLFCIQTGITSVVDALVSRFNSWAFTYIGLYGYGYNDAALHATELFQKRGWTIIVSDDLVPNVLLLSSVVLGGVSGCFSQLMEHLDPLSITSLDDPITVAFAVGVVNGIVLTSVLFSVISSAVNAVIVCFATSPVDFDQNHPQLSDDMRNAWREVWPGALDLVDLRIAMASPALGCGPHFPNAADGLSSLFIPPGGGGNM